MWLLFFFSTLVLFTRIHTKNLTVTLKTFDVNNNFEEIYIFLQTICPNIQFPINPNENKWTLSMLDSCGKLPSSLLSGHSADLGNYDQCLKIEGSTIEGPFIGKYCFDGLSIYVNDPNGVPMIPIATSIAICIPSTCDFQEIQSEWKYYTSNKLCQTRETFKSFDIGDWVVSILFGTILISIILQTCYDIYLHYTESKSKHDILIVFSILTNGRKLMACDNDNPKKIHCLSGIKVISMAWIVAAHRYAMYITIPVINGYDVLEWEKSNRSFYVHSAHAAVDTFFFITALLISYSYFQMMHKRQMSLKDIPLYYLHRIIRILPAVAAIFAGVVTLNRHIYNGPLWGAYAQGNRVSCIKWWWTYFLFVQNYVNFNEMCLKPTWYLSADMQLYWLSPFIIIPMGKLILSGKRKLAYIFIVALILMGITIPMIVDLFRDNDNGYTTHGRISVYALGIFLGLILYEYRNKKIHISNSVNLLLWSICLPVMLGIVLTMGNIFTEPSNLKTNLYFAFTRPAWAIGLSWIVFACVTGRGGIINWFLSRPIFEKISKLTFSMYLIHLCIIEIYVASMRTSDYFNLYHVIYLSCGDLTLCYFVALFWTLAFESPMIMIEKIIFKRGMDNKKDIKNEEIREKEILKF